MKAAYARMIDRELPRLIWSTVLGGLLAAVCLAAEPITAEPSAASESTETTGPADTVTAQPAEPPFQATLLLIRNDWSQSPKAAEIAAEMRQAFADLTVPPKTLDELPASGPTLLFSEELVSYYEPDRARELIEWLKVNDLIADTIVFPTPKLITEILRQSTSQSPSAPYFATSLTKDFDSLGLVASVGVQSEVFVERTMNFRWTIQLQDNHFSILRYIVVQEKYRGEPTAREIPLTVERPLSCAAGRTAMMDALSDTSRSSRRPRLKGVQGIILIEPVPSENQAVSVKAQLHLPDQVEQVRFSRPQSTQARSSSGSPTQATVSSQGDQAIRLYELVHVRAETLMATLQQLYPDKLLVGVTAGRNQLIVRGSVPQLDEVSALVERLDRPAEATEKDAAQPAPQPQTGSRSPADPSSRVPDTKRSKIEWQQQYSARERAAMQLAQKVRELATRADDSPADAQQLQAVRNELRAVVTEAFAARQQLHRVELAELEQRMARVEQTLAVRDRIQDQIIDRRVDDLLNPNLLWESEPSSAPSGPIRAPGMPGSYPANALPPANVPETAQTAPAAPAMLREVPTDTSGILRRATEFQAEFRKLQETIDGHLASLERRSSTDVHGRNISQYGLAKARQELAALRAEFDTQVRLLELNVADAKQALDAAVRKRDLTKSLHERGVVPVSELADVERAVSAAQHALERAETILDLYRKIELPTGNEEPKPADPPGSTRQSPEGTP